VVLETTFGIFVYQNKNLGAINELNVLN